METRWSSTQVGKVLNFKPRVGKVQTGQTANGPNHKWIYYNFPYIILVFSLLSPTFHSLSFLLFSIRFSSFQSHPASPLFLSHSHSQPHHIFTLPCQPPCNTTPRLQLTKKKTRSLFSLTNRYSLSSLLSFTDIFPLFVPLFLRQW